MDDKKYLGACLEDCVHTAGILNFFQVISDLGYDYKFLGPANKISKIIKQIFNCSRIYCLPYCFQAKSL